MMQPPVAPWRHEYEYSFIDGPSPPPYRPTSMNRHSLIVLLLGLPLACSPATPEYIEWEQILERRPGKSILQVALDKSHVYYFEDSESGWPYESLWRIPKDGGTPELLAGDQYRPRRLTIDHTRIYWAEGEDDRPARVFALNKQGGTLRVLASGQDEVAGLAFDDEYVYWSENESGRVHRARKDGSEGPTVFLEIPDRMLGRLAVYDGALYVNTNDYNCRGDPGWVIRAPLDAPHASQTVASFENCALEFAVGEKGVFILAGEFFHPIRLVRAPLLGGPIEVLYEQPQGRTLRNLLLDGDGVLFEHSHNLWRWTSAGGAHLVGPPHLEMRGKVAADAHALYRSYGGISRVLREDLPL